MQPRAGGAQYAPKLSVLHIIEIVQPTLNVLGGNRTLKDEKFVHVSAISVCVLVRLIWINLAGQSLG
jgi:hypothetical protein